MNSQILAYNNFANVLAEAKKRVEKFSDAKKENLKIAINHGLGHLKLQSQLDMYLYLYGEIHQQKLQLAFEGLPQKILYEEGVSVIDYGCGQGIASMVLCDFLYAKVGHSCYRSDFHLIEPSLVCLMKSVEFVRSFCPNALIYDYNDVCGSLWRMNIHPRSEIVLHLFSNVVDI